MKKKSSTAKKALLGVGAAIGAGALLYANRNKVPTNIVFRRSATTTPKKVNTKSLAKSIKVTKARPTPSEVEDYISGIPLLDARGRKRINRNKAARSLLVKRRKAMLQQNGMGWPVNRRGSKRDSKEVVKAKRADGKRKVLNAVSELQRKGLMGNYESSMQLAKFARKKGSKDKRPRKRVILLGTAGAGAIGAGIGTGLARHKATKFIREATSLITKKGSDGVKKGLMSKEEYSNMLKAYNKHKKDTYAKLFSLPEYKQVRNTYAGRGTLVGAGIGAAATTGNYLYRRNKAKSK